MFYRQQRCYHTHTHGLFFILSLIAAFILGRKSQEYGYTIIARGCKSSKSNEDNDQDKENNKEKETEEDIASALSPSGT